MTMILEVLSFRAIARNLIIVINKKKRKKMATSTMKLKAIMGGDFRTEIACSHKMIIDQRQVVQI